jgi:hypothetical protein
MKATPTAKNQYVGAVVDPAHLWTANKENSPTRTLVIVIKIGYESRNGCSALIAASNAPILTPSHKLMWGVGSERNMFCVSAIKAIATAGN